MFNKMGLIDFRSHIKKLVSEAYYTGAGYLQNKNSWVEVRRIELDYSETRDDYELPIVIVDISFADITVKGPVLLTVVLDLNMSDDFNIGHICSAIERMESD